MRVAGTRARAVGCRIGGPVPGAARAAARPVARRSAARAAGGSERLLSVRALRLARMRGRSGPSSCGGNCSWPWACGPCPRARRPRQSFMAASTATAIPSRKLLCRAIRVTSSRAISIVPRDAAGDCRPCSAPHGHWANGRFYDDGAKHVREEIAVGAERFETGGRYPLQARCVQLARMGCVVFHLRHGRLRRQRADCARGRAPGRP